MHLRFDRYSVISRVVSSAFLEGIHEFLPFQKTARPGDNLIHSPSCLPNGVIKNSCLGADYSWPGLALKDFEHVTLEEESCSGKIDREIGLCQVKAESGTIDGWNHFIEGIAFRLKSSVTLSGCIIGSL